MPATQTVRPSHSRLPMSGRTGTRVVVPVLVLAALVVLIQLYVAIPLSGSVAADFGSGGITASLAGVYSLCYAVGFLVYGPLSDHFGRRGVLVIGLATLAAATVAVGFAPSLTVLGVLRAIQGAAAATFAPTALAYLGESLPPRRRATAIGAMSVSFLTAGIIGQLYATAAASIAGWRWVFFISGIVLASLTVAVFVAVDEPDVDRPRQRLVARYASLIRFALRRSSLLLAACHLVVLGGFVGLYTQLGPHLTRAGFGATEVTVVRACGLPAMFCSLLAGPLVARFGAARTAFIGFSVAAVGLVGEAGSARSLIVPTAASIIFVAGVAIVVPTMITLWGNAAHPTRGMGMALNGFVLFLGASLGSYALALPGGFHGALAILVALQLIAGSVVLIGFRAQRSAIG